MPNTPRTRWQPMLIAGREFKYRKDLEEAIHAELWRLVRNKPVRSDFLAAVINALHEGVRSAGQRATGAFEILDAREQRRRGMDTVGRFHLGLDNPNGILVTAWFQPLKAWRPCSVYPWRKSLRPEIEIKRALREKIGMILPRPNGTDSCARGYLGPCEGVLEYEHRSPTFDQIAQQCIALIAPAELQSLFGYNKFVPGREDLVHCIPDDHPAIRLLRQLHTGNDWVYLCSYHHRGAGRLLADSAS